MKINELLVSLQRIYVLKIFISFIYKYVRWSQSKISHERDFCVFVENFSQAGIVGTSDKKVRFFFISAQK